MKINLKRLIFPFWGYSFGILVFILLVKFDFISTELMGINVSSLEVVLIIYALALGLVQIARQSYRLNKLSAIATDLGNGVLNKRSTDLNFDSIGNLAHALNKMAGQIEDSISKLQEAGDNLEEQNSELHSVVKIEAHFGAFLESIASVETNDLVKTSLEAFREISETHVAWLVYFDSETKRKLCFKSSSEDFRTMPDVPFKENMEELSKGRRWSYISASVGAVGDKALQIPIQFDGKPLGVVILENSKELEGRGKRRLRNYVEAFSNALSNCISYQTVLRQSKHLESLNKELLLADQNRSNFVARMSHELRTPLNSIIGFSKILEKNKSGNLSDLDLDRLEKIHRNGNHLLQMINNILDLSKIEASEMHVHDEIVDLDELTRDVIDMLEPQADSKGLYLVKEFEEAGLTTCTDGLKLRQVLINIVGNAIKFTKVGGVRVICEVQKDDPQFLKLKIEDTGIGIESDKHEEIFNAFSQADHSIPLEYGGTGLGLTISKTIVNLIGGTLDLKSVSGQGSVFTIRLPIRIKTNQVEINDLLVKK